MAFLPLSLLSFSGFALFLAATVTFFFVRLIYRLYFHPLAKFPGPKLAAATSLYNAYYDCIGEGLCKELPKLHRQYGLQP